MPWLGETSARRLRTCDPRLQLLCYDVIPWFDFAVTCGHRSHSEQAALYAKGRTEPGDVVTWAKPGQSKHNGLPSLAVDLAPWPIDWHDLDRFVELSRLMKLAAALRGIDLEWGGDWPRRKRDMPHYQVPVKADATRAPVVFTERELITESQFAAFAMPVPCPPFTQNHA